MSSDRSGSAFGAASTVAPSGPPTHQGCRQVEDPDPEVVDDARGSGAAVHQELEQRIVDRLEPGLDRGHQVEVDQSAPQSVRRGRRGRHSLPDAHDAARSLGRPLALSGEERVADRRRAVLDDEDLEPLRSLASALGRPEVVLLEGDGTPRDPARAAHPCRQVDGFDQVAVPRDVNPVSYTHLTLPTIYSV